MRGRTALLALAMLPAACRAGASDYLTYEKLSVPFDGLRVHRNPMAPYSELLERLKREAAAEARDDRFAPVVSLRHVGRSGERMLVSAITPRKGVFYYTQYGPYGSGPGPTIVERRGEIEVCRFSVRWDALPGGAYAPGFDWAAFAFPDLGCNRLDGANLSGAAEWRRRSESASYRVVGSGTDSGLRAALVQERWPGERANQPFDGGRAVTALAGGQDRMIRAIPVSEDLAFYIETAAGRIFTGIHDRPHGSGSETVCVVEGLHWSHIASDDGRRRAVAANLCERLFNEYRAGSGAGAGGSEPRMIALPPTER